LIKNSELKSGITYCLDNGKRLLDDAFKLQKKKLIHTAIPLYILGYEEIGKAIFLEQKFHDGEDVSDDEWREFSFGGSHITKILVRYQSDKNAFEKMTDSQFDEYAADARRSKRFWWGGMNRIEAIRYLQDGINMLKMFHPLKMRLLYVDYKEGKWKIPLRFSNHKYLDSLCTLLWLEGFIAYYTTRFRMDLNEINPNDPSQAPKWLDKLERNKNFAKYQKIYNAGRSGKYSVKIYDANIFLKSLFNQNK